MSDDRVNYNQIAPNYHQRYAVNPLAGVAGELRALAQRRGAGDLLEVGCGTGRWLAELQPFARCVHGVDLSPGMLSQARERDAQFRLTCADANHLPFSDAVFDLVFCVNALHHFGSPRAFVAEARRLLRPGGALAVVNMDPHTGRDRWYLYDYFTETREIDLCRFPSGGALLDWMIGAGFTSAEWRVTEHIYKQQAGREVLDDHFLQKHGTSQLALLSDEAYAAGLSRIHAALAEAEASGTEALFTTDLWLTLIVGWIG